MSRQVVQQGLLGSSLRPTMPGGGEWWCAAGVTRGGAGQKATSARFSRPPEGPPAPLSSSSDSSTSSRLSLRVSSDSSLAGRGDRRADCVEEDLGPSSRALVQAACESHWSEGRADSDASPPRLALLLLKHAPPSKQPSSPIIYFPCNPPSPGQPSSLWSSGASASSQTNCSTNNPLLRLGVQRARHGAIVASASWRSIAPLGARRDG